MSATRPPLQAKYELLLENKRTASSPWKSLVAIVLVTGAVAASCLTIYLAWCVMQPDIGISSLPRDLKEMNSDDLQLHRLKIYKLAFEIMNSSTNFNDTINIHNYAVVPSANKDDTLLKLVCYYSLPLENGLKPEGIQPKLCTHINIASLGVVNKSLETITPDVSQVIKDVVVLKKKNPSLKVLLCVAGYSTSGGFNDMVATHDSRKRFISQVVKVLEEYSLDGVDLDWEFPGWPNGKERERVKFNQLLQEMRESLDSRHKGWLLSVAVASPVTVIDMAYDIKEMERHIDYINLMAYDYHFYVWYLPVTGANAPLYRRNDEGSIFATLNTNWSSWYWVQKGMPKEKIVVGVPTYGHSFKLQNVDNHGWSAPASGNGDLGTNGFVTYPEVCWFLNEEGATQNFDSESEVPYGYLGQEWVSYDNIRSVTYKTKFAVNGGFGGVMIFSLNQDDYKGECAGSSFLLTQQVRNVLFDDQL